jgi:tol-pal system protein YbgF
MSRWPRAALLSGSLALLATGACGRGESAEDRQLAQIREELDRVQAERDGMDQRLNALEIKSADEGRSASASAHRATVGDAAVGVPQLRVVRLRPDGAEDDGAAGSGSDDDEANRPALSAAGSGGGNLGVGSSRGLHSSGSDGVRPSALDPQAKRAYAAALALVNGKHYPEALDAFAAFLMKWPDHPNADNAMYWRGECYFAQGDFTHAAEQFEGTVARFPLGNKAPDALLKLAMSDDKLGNHDAAQQAYDRLARDFPKSEAARRIPSSAAPASGSKP